MGPNCSNRRHAVAREVVAFHASTSIYIYNSVAILAQAILAKAKHLAFHFTLLLDGPCGVGQSLGALSLKATALITFAVEFGHDVEHLSFRFHW